jgi:hypothetical protein
MIDHLVEIWKQRTPEEAGEPEPEPKESAFTIRVLKLTMGLGHHSQSSSLTSVNGRMGSTQTTKEAWSGTQMGPRLIKALVLVCIDGAQEGGTASVLGSIPWYSRLTEIYVIKACIM